MSRPQDDMAVGYAATGLERSISRPPEGPAFVRPRARAGLD